MTKYIDEGEPTDRCGRCGCKRGDHTPKCSCGNCKGFSGMKSPVKKKR